MYLSILNYIAGFLAVLFALFVPGFSVSIAVFPEKELNLLERILLSVLFSITIIPFLMLLENKIFLIKINYFSAVLNLAAVIIISLTVYLIRKKGKNKYNLFYKKKNN